jgi:septal ring factor EnvC (AmiA/AmiB activator)
VKFLWNLLRGTAITWGLVLLLVAITAASDIDESRRKLEEVQKRIAQTAKNLVAKQTAEHSLAEDLQTVETEISRLGTQLARQKRRLAAMETEIADREEAAASARRAAAASEADVRRRLAALYKAGETGLVKILFSPSSPAQMAQDYDFLGRVVRRDRELLATYRQQLDELQTVLARLTILRREQQAGVAALAENQKTARQALRLKEELLVQVRRDRQSLAAALAELREKAGRLAGLVKKLESEKPREYSEKTGFFASRKGRLPWPVEGIVRIGFGAGRHPELGTMYDSHGIEIAAAGENPIRAIGPGRVLFANWFKGYGNLLIIDHGDSYYSLYAQASRLSKKVGDLLAGGDILGYSGLEGSKGIYFEIRRGGTPLDPLAWLLPR